MNLTTQYYQMMRSLDVWKYAGVSFMSYHVVRLSYDDYFMDLKMSEAFFSSQFMKAVYR